LRIVGSAALGCVLVVLARLAAAQSPPAKGPPASASAAATNPVAAAASADRQKPAPGQTVGQLLGAVAKVRVEDRRSGVFKPCATIARPADVRAIVAAIGMDQVPSEGGRRCPDSARLVFLDRAGKSRGRFGICSDSGFQGDLLGPEMVFPAIDRLGRGVKVADWTALQGLVMRHIEPW
jgi:hypothetical protein